MKHSIDSQQTKISPSRLDVRISAAKDAEWFDQQLGEHHYLGAGRPVGDYLRQVVALDGTPVALLVWGPACYALKDRDLWISWSAFQRVERLKLIVGLYYQEECSLREIGEVLGVTESRVCQLHGEAVHRIRASLEMRTTAITTKKPPPKRVVGSR